MAEVEKLFTEMEIQHIRQLLVFNKVDALEDQLPLEWARREYPDALYISARQHIGIDKLEAAMKQVVADSRKVYEIIVATHDGKMLSKLHQVGEVLSTEVIEEGLIVKVSLLEADAARLGLAPQ
jgi:GTP-binding protein HflX